MENVPLMTIGNGAISELFERELARVLENIQDVNTVPDGARTITIKVKLTPWKTRDRADIEISCDSKLSPVETYRTNAFVVKRSGRLALDSDDPKQTKLFVSNSEQKEEKPLN